MMMMKYHWRKYGGTAVLCVFVMSGAAFISSTKTMTANSIIGSGEDYTSEDATQSSQTTCKIPGLVSRKQFFEHFEKIEYNCKDLRFFGTTKEAGMKAVCLDHHFSMMPDECVVLSFGIDNEWSFDDDMDKYGCKVYAFDPTMGKEDHQRSKNIQFFNLGLGNIKGKRKIGMDDHFEFFKIDRYENILERLDLTDKVIDYIKMDIELSELDFFQDVFRNTPQLLKNVRQICVELHHGYFGEGIGNRTDQRMEMSPLSTFQMFWQYFHELRCHGFKIFHVRDAGKWTEVVWGLPT